MSLTQDILTAVTGQSFEYSGIFLPPGGYLWENGAAVSRTTYARLFNTITLSVAGSTVTGSTTISALSFDLTTLDHSAVGWPLSGPGIPAGATISAFTSSTITMSVAVTATATSVSLVLAPFGVGDGATTFNVPDSRGRVTAGRDNMGGAAAGRMTAAGGVVGTKLGNTAGTETHTLSAAEMPAHNHGVTDPGHVHGVTDPGHAHSVSDPGHGHGVSGGVYGSASLPYNYYGVGGQGGPGTPIGINAAATGIGIYAAATSISIKIVATGITTQSNGSGNAHAIMQPTIVKHKIIKT